MTDTLAAIEQQARKGRNFDQPPLHLWHPPLSGDIDIRIAADGSWYHEGRPIVRASLVRLFASLLRREADGDYYLVTPAEKWRIRVELHPLIVTEIDAAEEGGQLVLKARLNTGRQVVIDTVHPLFLEPAVGEIAAVKLEHGVSALLSRAAWYRLVDSAEEMDGHLKVRSAGEWFPLQ
jgi:hypothetical protein